jgi:hypothetical protein
MPFPPLQVLEINDFSGGITDNYLNGDPRRSKTIDNFLIQNDKSLLMRPALVPYQVPGSPGYLYGPNPAQGASRINGTYFFMPEKTFFVQNGRHIFTPSPAPYTLADPAIWQEMSGYGGNPALSGGDQYSQNTYAEFQRQVYFTNDGTDGLGVLPSKIYQDDSNLWRAKTAGLPKASVSGTYTSASLLAACIANANAIRLSMIAHMSDSANTILANGFVTGAGLTSPTALHINQDKFALSYLQATTFASGVDAEVPAPLPTPAQAATDQSSLFALVQALTLAYTHHITDASGSSINPIGTVSQLPFYSVSNVPGSIVPNAQGMYHQRPLVNSSVGTAPWAQVYASAMVTPQGGPYAQLNSSAAPTTLLNAAAMLDDILQKWNWHRLAVWTHSPTNTLSQMDQYAPVCTKIGLITMTPVTNPTPAPTTIQAAIPTPVVTPDYSDVINYVNNLKQVYHAHTDFGPDSAALEQTSGFYFSGHTMGNSPIYNLDLHCYLPDAQDLDSAYLVLYWLRALYLLHYRDANSQYPYTGITYTGTDGSAAITGGGAGGKPVVTATSVVVPYWQQDTYVTLFYTGNGGSKPTLFAGQQLASMAMGLAGQLNLDRTVIGNAAGALGQMSSSVYHVSTNGAGAFLDSVGGNLESVADQLAIPPQTVGQDVATWKVLAQDLFSALTNHMGNKTVHTPDYAAAASGAVVKALLGCKTPYFVPSVSNVSYAYFWTDRYTVGLNGIQYLVQSTPVQSQVTEVAVSNPVGLLLSSPTPLLYPSVINAATRGNKIDGLPVLTNDGTTNYDIENVMINIYRTIDGGQTYYFLAQLPNGTTSYLDQTNDTIQGGDGTPGLQNTGLTMYTTGGVVGSDQPPICKFTHLFSGTSYYAGINDNGQFFPQQIRQTIQFAPDWAPATFSVNLDDDVMGLSSTKANVIAFCKNSTYRLSGGFNQTGQGAITYDRIADSVGSLNSKGIVKTEIGVFWPGNDGFYYTDGYQVIKISLELDKTYLSLTSSDKQQRSIYGAYDKATRRIWWSMQTSGMDADNSIVYVFYLNFGIKPSGVFTTVSNGKLLQIASLTFLAGQGYFGDAVGHVLKTDENQKYDYSHDDITGPETDPTYINAAIPYNWTSSAISLGTTARRKYFTKAHVVGKNEGNVSAQIAVIKDLNQTGAGPLKMAPINYVENVTWGTPTCIWDTPGPVWKEDGKMDLWRRFPARSLRSDFMQLQFTPSFGVIYASKSGMYGQEEGPPPAGVIISNNGTNFMATLQNTGPHTAQGFFDDVVGCFLQLAKDKYVAQYKIIGVDGPDLTILDTSPGTLVVNLLLPYHWQIVGYKKQQRPQLQSVQLAYSMTGDTNQSYGGPLSSGGPGNAGGNAQGVL